MCMWEEWCEQKQRSQNVQECDWSKGTMLRKRVMFWSDGSRSRAVTLGTYICDVREPFWSVCVCVCTHAHVLKLKDYSGMRQKYGSI